MTNDLAVNGAKMVKPPNSIKLSLRCGDTKTSKSILLNREFIKAEEKMMDEEVTSVESALDDVEKVEEAMVAAALMNSVAERSINNLDTNSKEKKLYGLRQVRRSTGSDLKRLEHFQTTRDGGMLQSPRKAEENRKKGSSSLTPRVHPIAKKNERPVVGRLRKRVSDSITVKQQIPLGTSTVLNPVAFLPITSVPNPLAVPLPTQAVSSHGGIQARETMLPSMSTPIPCPLLDPVAPSNEFQLESEPAAEANENKQKVTFSNGSSPRDRAFSIDLDLALEFAEEQTAADSHEYHGKGLVRDRAYSFECFAFGINQDEPLPPVDENPSSNSETTHPRLDSIVADENIQELHHQLHRPRGDSIIFDPSSFQDGGIHEINALERAPVLTDENVDMLVDNIFNGIASGTDFFPLMTTSHPVSISSSDNVAAIGQEPRRADEKVLSGPNGAVATGNLPHDILNKDGRIGIYLPEERRIRIARFHAKRANRIWRKRIKYDCRKKLADSRPRIKGRFVKRLDMEDD